MSRESTRRYEPQLGNIPADDSKLVYLEVPLSAGEYRAHNVNGEDGDFILCVLRNRISGRMESVITTKGYLKREDEIHKIECEQISKGKFPPQSNDRPFLTEVQKKILVEANKDLITIDKRGYIKTIDDSPFLYELAEKVVQNANGFLKGQNREEQS